MNRIAILHYTALPAVGGIENLIEAQRTALLDLGYAVRLIVGEGDEPPGGELCRVPELHPSHPDVICALSELSGGAPPPDHPLVEATCRRLRDALGGCTQCWVHNAFTVYLNPFLTVALLRLTQELPEIAWVAWCSDLSHASAYWRPLAHHEWAHICTAQPGVTYVAVSQTRRVELSRHLALDEGRIRVIEPPLDASWLDLGPEAQLIARRLGLQTAEPIILVPAKLLEHKNLELAVRVATSLRTLTPRPAVLLTGAASPHDRRTSRGVRRRVLELAEQLGAADALHVLPDLIGGVPARRTVRDLMLLSDLVLLSSTEEGFGMPLREAAALRTPVLCSDIPAFREVGGEYARYFSPDCSARSIAIETMDIVRHPANQKRREAIWSSLRFPSQLEELCNSSLPNASPRTACRHSTITS